MDLAVFYVPLVQNYLYQLLLIYDQQLEQNQNYCFYYKLTPEESKAILQYASNWIIQRHKYQHDEHDQQRFGPWRRLVLHYQRYSIHSNLNQRRRRGRARKRSWDASLGDRGHNYRVCGRSWNYCHSCFLDIEKKAQSSTISLKQTQKHVSDAEKQYTYSSIALFD
ncbi:Hypothetical_protein [Hexamita inflata]|uniref:Hypothetical_protein n=1 Tax=Hexamita inflata TaxID=28002 RepID=A0AA86RII7_9EUKA|nr:Hypothetical protein HINF_LOCUS63056 [Hexamita inflata]CAI9975413.1 Hypothetical protein HINF_LOCUS63058 [Hexamita inflata]